MSADKLEAEAFNPFHLAAYAGGRPELQSRVVDSLQRRVEGEDRHFNALAGSEEIAYPKIVPAIFYDEAMPLLDRKLWEDIEARKLDLTTRSGRSAFVFEMILNGLERGGRDLEEHAARLISQLNLDYKLISEDLEAFANSPGDLFNRRGAASRIIERVRSPDYLASLAPKYAAMELDLALQALRKGAHSDFHLSPPKAFESLSSTSLTPGLSWS